MNYKDNTIFDLLDNITRLQSPNFIKNLDDQEKKKLSPYMTTRWLSMKKEYLPLCNFLNKHTFEIDIENFYHICRYFISKPSNNKKIFFKYIKSDKKKDYPDWLIDIIVEEYMINRNEAKDYLDIIFKNKENITYLLRKYPVEEKQYKSIGLKRRDVFHNKQYEKQEKKVEIKEVSDNRIRFDNFFD